MVDGNTEIKIYTVELNSGEATTRGTREIYLNYGISYSLTSGGEAMTSSSNKITIPTRTGYTFGGYYTGRNKTGNQIIQPNGYLKSGASLTALNSDGIFYAYWTPNDYTITFDQNYLPGDVYGVKPINTDQWSQATATTSARALADNAEAKYGKEIRLTMNEGTSGGPHISPPCGRLTVGKTYTWSLYIKASSPKTLLIGHEQSGRKTVNVTTSWQRITHTFTAEDTTYNSFTFYLSGSTWTAGDILYVHSLELAEASSLNVTSSSKTYGTELGTLPTPSRDGHTFVGWFTEPTGGTQISATTTVPVDGTTYYAHWTVNSYKQIVQVRYQNADGSYGSYSNVIDKNYNHGETVSWSRAQDATYNAASITSYTVTAAKTTQVSVTRRTYTQTVQIRYQNADGSYGSYSNAINTAYRYGATVSWSRAADTTYNAASITSYTVTAAKTTQVNITRKTFTQVVQVRYENANGTWGSYSNVINTAYRYGQTVSWSRAQDTTYKAASITSYTVTAAKTTQVSIYRRTYTAAFNGNGGSNGTSITKRYGEALGTLPTSTRANYKFNGWYTATSGGSKIATTTTMPAGVTYYAQWTFNGQAIWTASSGAWNSNVSISTTGWYQGMRYRSNGNPLGLSGGNYYFRGANRSDYIISDGDRYDIVHDLVYITYNVSKDILNKCSQIKFGLAWDNSSRGDYFVEVFAGFGSNNSGANTSTTRYKVFGENGSGAGSKQFVVNLSGNYSDSKIQIFINALNPRAIKSLRRLGFDL